MIKLTDPMNFRESMLQEDGGLWQIRTADLYRVKVAL